MGFDSDLPIYAPRPGYNPNITAPASILKPSTNEPPPPYHGPPPSVTTAATTTTQTVFIPVPQPELDRKPQRMICPNCHKQIKTKVTYKSTGSAWASCCALACLGCCLCCLLPFCLDSFQDITHRCPKCKAYIGKYHK